MTGTDRRIREAVEPPGQRLVAGILRSVLRMTLGRTFVVGLPVAEQRQRLRRVTRLTLPPRGSRFEPAQCGAAPGEWTRVAGAADARFTFLYLHGGGYCTGAPSTHRAITGHLAKLCGASVFAPDYRLAPEHPFPAAVDDAVAAFRGLVAGGAEPDRIVIAGDSAGGGLSVATALRLRELGVPMPRALVLFSPWVDLTLEQAGPAPPGEVMLSIEWVGECARAYVVGHDPRLPLISPVGADLRGLPPTLIQVGTDELLLNDSRRLRRKLEADGVRVSYEEFPARWHVFQANAGVLADANRALETVARFVDGAAPG
jgi:monoterpene epsilon-lactone hydrolase